LAATSTNDFQQPNINQSSEESADILLRKAGFRPRWIIELGSGFDTVGQTVGRNSSVPYSELPDLITPTTSGHSGVVRFCRGSNGGAFLFCGRSHLYEGISLTDAAGAIRIASVIKTDGIILCSACGGIGLDVETGNINLFDDVIHFPSYHCNRYGKSKLNHTVDLIRVPHKLIDPDLSNEIKAAACRTGITLGNGIIAIVTGPSYETQAEIEALRRLSASAVTMSCNPALKQTAQLGVPAVILGGVTNRAGRSAERLTHRIILEKAETSIAPKMIDLIKELIGC